MTSTNKFSPYAAAHAKPKGAGDARPTALQIIEDYKLNGAWKDKTIMITGVSSGIGVETARGLAATGATLYLTARSLLKARTALGDLATSPNVHLLELDLTTLASVRSCAKDFLSKSQRLNILITNAGIRNTALGHTSDGFEKQFQVNHLSHFLLIDLLTPILLASTTPTFHSRVVCLSSSDHRNFPDDNPINWNDLNFVSNPSSYTPAKGYTQSKLANVYTSTELNRRYAAKGINANAVMPGGIMTGLQQGENGNAIREVLTSPRIWLKIFTIGKSLKSVEQGAASSVWAAVATELEGNGGCYIENCGVGGVVKGGEFGVDPGYGVKAFDEGGERRLWKISCEMVGVEDRTH